MTYIDLIGSIAASCTTFSFVPQAYKIIKTRDTKSISLFMYIIFSIGLAFWLFYGCIINSVPIILANSITLILSSIILFYKIRGK